MLGEDGRETAAEVLEDECVITRATGGVWTPEDGLPSGRETVYSGPCSLLASKERRQTDSGGDERLRITRTLLLPAGASYAPLAADEVAVASCATTGDGEPQVFYVVEDGARSHRVLMRVQVSATPDTEGVPR